MCDNNIFLSKHPVTSTNVISGNDVLVTYQKTIEVQQSGMEDDELRQSVKRKKKEEPSVTVDNSEIIEYQQASMIARINDPPNGVIT